MLPKGSFKDGYQEEYKEHRWMYDEDGNKNERAFNRGRKPKALAIEDDEKNDEVEQVEAVEEVEQVEAVEEVEDDGAGTGLEPKEDPEPIVFNFFYCFNLFDFFYCFNLFDFIIFSSSSIASALGLRPRLERLVHS